MARTTRGFNTRGISGRELRLIKEFRGLKWACDYLFQSHYSPKLNVDEGEE